MRNNNPVLVRSSLRLCKQTPVSDELSLLVKPEDDICIANIDSQQHTRQSIRQRNHVAGKDPVQLATFAFNNQGPVAINSLGDARKRLIAHFYPHPLAAQIKIRFPPKGDPVKSSLSENSIAPV